MFFFLSFNNSNEVDLVAGLLVPSYPKLRFFAFAAVRFFLKFAIIHGNEIFVYKN